MHQSSSSLYVVTVNHVNRQFRLEFHLCPDFPAYNRPAKRQCTLTTRFSILGCFSGIFQTAACIFRGPQERYGTACRFNIVNGLFSANNSTIARSYFTYRRPRSLYRGILPSVTPWLKSRPK